MTYNINELETMKIILSDRFRYEDLLEINNLRNCLILCNNILNESEVNLRFIIFWGYRSDEEFLLKEYDSISLEVGVHSVLIWIGDETGYIPSDEVFKHFLFIFKVHLYDKDALFQINGVNVYRDRLFHFPLLTVDKVPSLPIKSLDERDYFVYYCGNLNICRWRFYATFKHVKSLEERIVGWFIKNGIKGKHFLFSKVYTGKTYDFSDKINKSYIKFYSGFNNGSSYGTYAKFLQNSRIVLSPCGFVSTECFRFYEAMKQGCIVITEQLPHTVFYKNAPCITINDWTQLPTILSDNKLLSTFDSAKIRAFYDEHLSPEAIAKYVADIILTHL